MRKSGIRADRQCKSRGLIGISATGTGDCANFPHPVAVNDVWLRYVRVDGPRHFTGQETLFFSHIPVSLEFHCMESPVAPSSHPPID